MLARKLDRLWHEGIFDEPKNCTDDEIELLEYYADTLEIDLYTRDEMPFMGLGWTFSKLQSLITRIFING